MPDLQQQPRCEEHHREDDVQISRELAIDVEHVDAPLGGQLADHHHQVGEYLLVSENGLLPCGLA